MRGGFCVNVILMDQEFTKIVDDMNLVLVNITAAREHMTEIEHGIRTTKESCCSTVSLSFPYKAIPKQVVIHLINISNLQINSAPANRGIGEKFSPHEFVTHRELDYGKHCKGDFGENVLVHVDGVDRKNM